MGRSTFKSIVILPSGQSPRKEADALVREKFSRIRKSEKSVALSSVHLDVPLTSLAQPLEPLVEVDALGHAHGLQRESDLTYFHSRRRNTRANARSPAIVTGNQAMPAEAGAEGDGSTGQTRSSMAAHKSVTGLRGRGGGGFVP